MLYDGALRFMEAGKKAMVDGNRERQNANLQKAQKIVTELMACLDMDRGGEIAKNLLGLYSYVLNELVQANVEDDPQGIDRCLRVMSELRESWSQVAKAASQPIEAESDLAA
jgi:flagellar secretion chaperone FliS